MIEKIKQKDKKHKAKSLEFVSHEKGEPYREFLETYLRKFTTDKNAVHLIELLIHRFKSEIEPTLKFANFYGDAVEGNLNIEELDIFLEDYVKKFYEIRRNKVVVSSIWMIFIALVALFAADYYETIGSRYLPGLLHSDIVAPLGIIISTLIVYFEARSLSYLRDLDIHAVLRNIFISLNENNMPDRLIEEIFEVEKPSEFEVSKQNLQASLEI